MAWEGVTVVPPKDQRSWGVCPPTPAWHWSEAAPLGVNSPAFWLAPPLLSRMLWPKKAPWQRVPGTSYRKPSVYVRTVSAKGIRAELPQSCEDVFTQGLRERKIEANYSRGGW